MMNKDEIVIFTGKSNSWDFDDSIAKLYISNDGLVVGEMYNILEVSHGDYSCHIKLVGKDDKWFSTAFFKEMMR